MNNFIYHNPTKIVFGKGQIKKLHDLVPAMYPVMLTYGFGSIKNNGVYDQVKKALYGHQLIEFGGIEPNPTYETLMKAITLIKENNIAYLVSVGGGSVLDGTKFIAAAAKFDGADPWDIVAKKTPIKEAIPLGCVLTLPATGSESNCYAVISRKETQEKKDFGSSLVYPQFAVLDPLTTFSLSQKQLVNGVVDSFVHVVEQYLTYDCKALLQDRQAEAILQTLAEKAQSIINDEPEYETRATFMWCATQALNGLIGCGVPQDWSTHMIGHELTAYYGIDHAQSLAVILPRVLESQIETKKDKLAQYAQRVWQLPTEDVLSLAQKAITKTETFFRDLGMKTTLSEYCIDPQEASQKIFERFTKASTILGEQGSMTPACVRDIVIKSA
ncbi:MAG: iron-containing alcohol dehydrogenase [bacterium]|nr:iron-containing alcohol dehydrogenase [bacterium]MBU1918522.1 iron-containing alcohol dehydrogenase [bacterium]